MADPFSVAAGAIGVVSLSLQLLGGCIKGFVILSAAHSHEKDAATIVCMLNLQEIQLVEWARRAGLLTGQGLLDRRINANAVEETLLQLQTLLTDTKKLKKRYGLDVQVVTSSAPMPQDTRSVISVNTGVSDTIRNSILARSRVDQGHSVLQRFWWATVDKEKIEKLVADIHFLVRELWNLLDPWRQDDMIASTQSIAAGMISLNERFDQLTFLNEALAASRSYVSRDELRGDVDGLAISAKIKAYRVGLEQIYERPFTEREPNLPSQQKLLGGLENLSAGKLSDFKPIDRSKTMGISIYENQIVFVEQKPLGPPMPQKSLIRAKTLAALLNVSKSRTFGSLQCRGIIEDRDKVRFVFHHPYPDSKEQQPRSLLELLHHRDGIKPPSLTERIKLALQVACLVQNFHRAGWLHKSLRSENVLFFYNNDDVPVRARLVEPVLAGFAFSRQDSPTEISEQPSAEPRNDIYRHPSALGEPTTSFTADMDIYSLGVILLEIAEWRALRHLVDSVVDVVAETVPLNKIGEVRAFLIAGKGKGGTSRLQERMGDIYASATRMCLKGEVSDMNDAQGGVHSTGLSLLDAVVQRLNMCRV